ncbi:asparaginase domain-containing protein [Thiomicrospira sp. WB1]|uniref:asparaginase domain-containing protein n=1 Tax=Thiomicrospira sp. WB1 TaxID=1685380 RepID=UPI001F436A19|nr:asparaginase domain-containing protein [Thiomicrospira sp. WB1]
MTTAILVTGGTLDKDYDAIRGELGFAQTHLPKMLETGRAIPAPEVEILMLKDSLAMTEADRQIIVEACLNHPASRLVITHGTDTMTDTAKALMETSKLHVKTLVLTGAMRPWALGRSDADFNLGAALMAAQTAPSGVYVCMNGQLFTADDVQKNRQTGCFEPLTDA